MPAKSDTDRKRNRDANSPQPAKSDTDRKRNRDANQPDIVHTADPVNEFPGLPVVKGDYAHRTAAADPKLFVTVGQIIRFLGFDVSKHPKLLILHQNPQQPDHAVLRQCVVPNYNASVHNIGSWYRAHVEVPDRVLPRATLGHATAQSRSAPLFGWDTAEVLLETRIMQSTECTIKCVSARNTPQDVFKVEIRSAGSTCGGADLWRNNRSATPSTMDAQIAAFISAAAAANATGTQIFSSMTLNNWIATLTVMNTDPKTSVATARSYSTWVVDGLDGERQIGDSLTQCTTAAQQIPHVVCFVLGAGAIDTRYATDQLDIKQCMGCQRYPGSDMYPCICKTYRPGPKGKLNAIVSVVGEKAQIRDAVVQMLPSGTSVVDTLGMFVRATVSQSADQHQVKVQSIVFASGDITQISVNRRSWISDTPTDPTTAPSQADSDDSAIIVRTSIHVPQITRGLCEANFVFVSLLPKRFADRTGPVVALTDAHGNELNSGKSRPKSILTNFFAADDETSPKLWLIMGHWTGKVVEVSAQLTRPPSFADLWGAWMTKWAVAKPE